MFMALTSTLNNSQTNSPIGLAIATIIIFLWFASLIGFLTIELAQIPLVLIILGVLLGVGKCGRKLVVFHKTNNED